MFGNLPAMTATGPIRSGELDDNKKEEHAGRRESAPRRESQDDGIGAGKWPGSLTLRAERNTINSREHQPYAYQM